MANIKESVAKIGEDIADVVTNSAFAMENKVNRNISEKAVDFIVDKSAKIRGDLPNGIRDKALAKIGSEAGANRISNALGGAAGGAIAGGGIGVVAGGIHGAMDKDEGVLEGAARYGVRGALAGGAFGAASGALHNNYSLMSNLVTDADLVAKNIAKFKAKAGDGLSNVNSKLTENAVDNFN